MKPATQKTRVKYSVLLLYPDEIADAYGQETYYTFVTAGTPREALEKARRRCMDNNLEIENPEDLFCSLIIHGHKHDMTSVAQEG